MAEPRQSRHSERNEESPFPRHEILRCAQDDQNILSLGGAIVMQDETTVYAITRKSNE